MKYRNERGQTLVALLVFVMIGIMVTTAAAIILATNAISASRVEVGEIAKEEAETGVEEALVSLLRNSTYSGETLQMGSDSVVITVSGTSPIVIDSIASSGTFIRKVEINAMFTNNVLGVSSWKEIY